MTKKTMVSRFFYVFCVLVSGVAGAQCTSGSPCTITLNESGTNYATAPSGIDIQNGDYYSGLYDNNLVAYGAPSFGGTQFRLVQNASASTLAETFTANTTSGSSVLSSISSFTGLGPGQWIQGSGIPTNTYVVGSNVTSFTGTLSTSSTTVTNLSAFPAFLPGQYITGTGIPANTTVVSINNTGTLSTTTFVISNTPTVAGAQTLTPQFTLSAASTATATGVSLTGSASFSTTYLYDQIPLNFSQGFPLVVQVHNGSVSTGAAGCNTTITFQAPSNYGQLWQELSGA